MTRAYFSYLFGLRSQFPKPFIYRAPQSIGISWAIKAIGASFVIKFGLLSSVLGEGNGNPLQYSCLENSVDRGAWWAAVHGVAQSQTWLEWLSMRTCIGEGNGDLLQFSCLENPRDRGAWWAAIYGVTQSRTQLKWLSSNSSILSSYCFRAIKVKWASCYSQQAPFHHNWVCVDEVPFEKHVRMGTGWQGNQSWPHPLISVVGIEAEVWINHQ